MIIVEGADNVGKTTLCEALCKATSLPYAHLSRPPVGFDHLGGYVSNITPRVQDRWHLSALVYGMMLGTGRWPIRDEYALIQRYLEWAGAITILLIADEPSWLSAKLDESKKRELYAKPTIMAANDGFRLLAKATGPDGRRHADFVHDVSTLGWPGPEQVKEWSGFWQARWTRSPLTWRSGS